MKKLFFLITITLSFFLSSAAIAGYVITLKNGGSISTIIFWSEKEEIKFYWADGIVGILKEDILSIERIKESPGERIETIPYEKDPLPISKEAITGPEEISGKRRKISEAEPEKDKIDVEHYKKQKVFYTEKYQEAYERYLDAASRQDEEAKIKAWEEFNHFGGQVITLQEELKKKNKGVLPEWWKQ